MRKITIVDIANEAGVSFKTVSRVINNQTGVSVAVRAKIQAIIDAHEFEPNAAARSLKTRNYVIGLLFKSLLSHYYGSEVQIGAMRGCRQSGYNLHVDETKELGRNGKKKLKENLAKLRLDGAILPFRTCDDDELMTILEDLKIPYVRLTPALDLDRAAYITIDDRQAAYDMTKHLWKLGHRNIGFIGHYDHAASMWRYEGYKAFLDEHGMPATSKWDVIATRSLTQVFDAEALIKQSAGMTALFASTDNLATVSMAAASKLRIRIPDELSIVGFDDSPSANSVWPPLTTIHQPIAKMAETAVKVLVDHIQAGNPRRTQGVYALDYHLVKRGSAIKYPA